VESKTLEATQCSQNTLLGYVLGLVQHTAAASAAAVVAGAPIRIAPAITVLMRCCCCHDYCCCYCSLAHGGTITQEDS
jgi:hypothetical protein